MTEFTSGAPYKKLAPSRSGYLCTIILAVCAMLVLILVVCCYAVTVVADAILKGIDALFQGLIEPIAFAISMAIVLVLMALSWLMELAGLLSSGQFIPFMSRLLQFPM